MGLVRGARAMMEPWEWAWPLRTLGRDGEPLVWVGPPTLCIPRAPADVDIKGCHGGVATVPAGPGLHLPLARDGPSGPRNADAGEVGASAQTPHPTLQRQGSQGTHKSRC